MQDSIVRGRLLQLLCDRREEGALLFGASEAAVAPPAGVDPRTWLQALAELAAHGLIQWRSCATEGGAMLGRAELNEKGLDVCEGRVQPEIEIRFAC